MLDSQEKMKWENQMLETSLKGLQTDLAEYMQLQKRFEEVQREKKHSKKSSPQDPIFGRTPRGSRLVFRCTGTFAGESSSDR